MRCPSCGREQITVGGEPVSENCVFCGSPITLETIPPETDDELEDEPIEVPLDEGVSHISAAPLDPMTPSSIRCWFCNYLNLPNMRYCASCEADLFAVVCERGEIGEEKVFVSQLSGSEQELYLVEGLKYLILTILKREGNADGRVKCQHRGCGNMYAYDQFVCSKCGKPTLLQEMRGVLKGIISNRSLIEELKKTFPQYSITKYTNPAFLAYSKIAAAKNDLEDVARTTASILKTASVFLRASIAEPQRTRSESTPVERIEGGLSDYFDMSGVSNEPDTRVMELLNATPIDTDNQGIIEPPPSTDNEDELPWDSVE